jgi:hypothetical protein
MLSRAIYTTSVKDPVLPHLIAHRIASSRASRDYAESRMRTLFANHYSEKTRASTLGVQLFENEDRYKSTQLRSPVALDQLPLPELVPFAADPAEITQLVD